MRAWVSVRTARALCECSRSKSLRDMELFLHRSFDPAQIRDSRIALAMQPDCLIYPFIVQSSESKVIPLLGRYSLIIDHLSIGGEIEY